MIMHDTNKKMGKYYKSIKRRLNMPANLKERVMSDFISSIEARREAGQTDEQIYEELGTPKKAAAELNEQMKEYTYRKSPWRWICLVLIILCSISLLFLSSGAIIAAFSFPTQSVGIIGGADGPTSIIISTSPDYFQHQMILIGIVLVINIVGFCVLRRCKRK